jgi:hypothetical protein
MAKTSFPHVTNSTAAVEKFEPVVGSSFNCHFVSMGNLKKKIGDLTFLREYVKSVAGLFIEKAGGTIEAGFKTTKFRYDSNEKETFYEVIVNFHNFLDNDSRMFIYNTLVAWSRFKNNTLTGEKSLKKDYSDASIICEKFNRNGEIYWKRIGHSIFPMSDFDDAPADYSSHDMLELAVTFNCDFVSDVTNDPRLV